MKIGFCSSEVFPFSKTGGLADVCGALPAALEEEGQEVKIFTPLYKGIKPQEMNSRFGRSVIGKNIEVFFIRNDEYFSRDYLYGTPQGDYPDNLERFSFFARRVLEVIKEIGFRPHIMHCHDWQTGLIPVYLRYIFNKDAFYQGIGTIFTIHNLAYQGIFPADKFGILGLPQEFFSIDGLEFYGKINLLKGALLESDILTTVSPTYAREIQTSEFGCGLEGVLSKRKDVLFGVLNGLDYNIWDPQADPLIYSNYGPQNIEKKGKNKVSLQKDCGLKIDKDIFLLGFVGRLAEQKGIDLLAEIIPPLLEKLKAQIVILGTGDQKYHQILEELLSRYKSDKIFGKQIAIYLTFDETLAHRIYAGADSFLMPSRFEPCGLGQMISLKYATLPIVHRTGGLADTVVDVSQDIEKGNGFVFTDVSSRAFLECIERAQGVFSDKATWSLIQKRVINLSFSWRDSARNYIRLYNRCLGSLKNA